MNLGRLLCMGFLLMIIGGLVMADTAGVPATSAERAWRFDQDKTGKGPVGFESYSGRWLVKADATAPSRPNVLAQVATSETWPGIVVKDSNYKNVLLEVKFKAVSGNEDQAAGIIFRYKDPGNFYVFRANADEDNAVLFKFVNGHRSPIKSKGVKVPHNTWCTITVQALDSTITCLFNGQELFTVQNDLYKRGKIGLWTKADSVTHFDSFIAKPL